MQTIDRLSMFNIAVTDVDKAKKFYADAFGFVVKDDSAHDDSRWVSMEFPGGVSFILSNVHEHMKPGTLKFYLSSTDVEATQKELASKGVTAVKEGDDWGAWGGNKGAKWFEVTDPDGNHILVIPSAYQHKS